MRAFLALSSLAIQVTAAAASPGFVAPPPAAPFSSTFSSTFSAPATLSAAPLAAPLAASLAAPAAVESRSFLFKNPTMDLLALSALSKKSPTPSNSGSNTLSLLLLSGALNGGRGGGLFGGGLFGGPYYDQYGNYQDPAKKAILLSGVASGSVSPLTALAVDRNPGMTTTDTLVVSALGNSPLTSLLVLNKEPGEGLVSNGGSLFGGSYGSSYGGNGGILGNLGGGGVLPALVVAGAVGGSNNGLGTLLALDALGGLGNNNGYNSGGYYTGGFVNNGFSSGFSNNGYGFSNGFSNGNIFSNAADNARDLLG